MGGLTRRSTPATTHVSGDAPVSYGRAVNIRVIGQYCKEYLVCNRGSSSDERARASSGKAAAFQKDDESLSIGPRVAREAHIPHLSRTHPGTAADDWIIGKPDTLDAAVLAICLGTVCCSRVGELAGLQICNMAWGIDQAFGLEYVEGAGCRVRKRTNDTGRWGLCTRVPGGILLERLRRWFRKQGLEVSPLCTDQANPGARCPFCPPLFPRTLRAAGAPIQNAKGYNLRLPVTRQMVSSGVKMGMKLLGADPRHFSGISMRRGGISAAINAGVPKPILFLQGGHGAAVAGRRYMQLTEPTLLYATGLFSALLEGGG